MAEQYDDPSDGYFEAPAPFGETDGEQFPDDGAAPGRIPLAPIKVRPAEPKEPDSPPTAGSSGPPGLHRLRKGMILKGNRLERPMGGGKSPDVWQATHPELGRTVVKVVTDAVYPAMDIKKIDPIGFDVRERVFLEFERFHRFVYDDLAVQRPGDGALSKVLDMGRTDEGRIFKVYNFLANDVFTLGSTSKARSKESLEPAPTIDRVKAITWDQDRKMRLVRSLLLSLWQLHRRQLVHGDIKPRNILVLNTPSGHVARLIDYDNCFPSGKPFDASHIGGDESYYSPERADYQEGELEDVSMLTTSTDLFSLALVLHKVLSARGKLPEWSVKKGSAAESCAVGGVAEYLSLGTGNARLEHLLGKCLLLEPSSRPFTHELLVASGVYIDEDKE